MTADEYGGCIVLSLHKICLKVSKCEIFDFSEFYDFYTTHTVSTIRVGGVFGVKILFLKF
jgi:hypothetical protein